MVIEFIHIAPLGQEDVQVRKSLNLLLSIVTVFMAVLLLSFSQTCIAQEGEATEDIFDRRHVAFGYSSDGGVHNISINATLPVNQINGGLTAGVVRTISDGESLSDEADARIESGFETDYFQAKAFVGLERSLQKGSDLTKEVGAYVGSPELKLGYMTVELAVGSLFESTEYQEALNLESENAGRLLGIAKVSAGGLGVFIETTPHITLSDFEISLRPHYRLSVSNNFGVRFDAEYDYTSKPVVGTVKWASRWSLNGDLEF